MKYITNNEIACDSYEDASKILEILLKNNYVCMLSQEENLTIINYEWEEYCNRNGMIFRNRSDWEWEQEKEWEEEHKEKELYEGESYND